MDTKLRILLRQYAATSDPQMAVEVANAMLRLESSRPTVFSLETSLGGEHPEVTLYYTQEAAEQAGIDYIKDRVWNFDIETASRYYHELDVLEKLINNKEYGQAIGFFNQLRAHDGYVIIRKTTFEEDKSSKHLRHNPNIPNYRCVICQQTFSADQLDYIDLFSSNGIEGQRVLVCHECEQQAKDSDYTTNPF